MLDELAAEQVPDEVYDRHVRRPNLPLLLGALKEPARTVTQRRLQENICIVLEHAQPDGCVPTLLRVLETSPKARVRRAALRALAALPPLPTPRACQLLLKGLRDERDEESSHLSARVLGKLDRPPERVLDELETRLYDDRRSVRQAAARALHRPRESALQALEDLTRSDWTAAVDALLRLDQERAVPFLLKDGTERALWRMDRVPSLVPYLAERAGTNDLALFQLEANLRRQLPRVRARGLLAEREGDPLEWADALAELGLETAARAGVAAARCVLFLWAEAYPDDLPPMDALWHTERWLLDPTLDPTGNGDYGISQFCTPGSFAAGWACKRAAEVPTGRPLREAVMWAIRALMGSTGIVPVGGHPEAERLSLRDADTTVRSAIARELAPWQRGEFDPLAVAAQQARRKQP